MEQSTCFKVLVMPNVIPITTHFKVSFFNACHELVQGLSLCGSCHTTIINTTTLQVVSSASS